MKFGTIVRLKKDIVQGSTTFNAGMNMAVAHYSHKYFVRLNTFGDERNISDLVEVQFNKINEVLEVVGQLHPIFNK
jgi:hypothetical protein